MFQQVIKTTKGKWAVALGAFAIVGSVSSLSQGSTEAIPGAILFLAGAAALVLSAIKDIKNPPPTPTVEDLGIHVSQADLDAFKAYGTLPNVENSPIMLADGEQAVYASRATRVETKNRRLGTTGGGGGMSVRVAKGVRVRTGGTQSKSVYGDVEMTHNGEFVVTTQRIVFVASSRAFEEKLQSISAVTVEDGCLVIMGTKDNYSLRMPLTDTPCDIIRQCIKAL